MRAPLLALVVSLAAFAPAGAFPEVCTETPDPARWEDAGAPDAGLDPMRITVHRGAADMAPEDTIPAFEYAIAYGAPMIEVDVQQTLDGRWVVLHDYEVSGKTDGEGYIFTMTYEQATQLNAADNDRWRGSEYDPTPVPGLEEVLALASEHEIGINFDLKESVPNAAGVALLAAQYEGVIERSIFQPYVPGRAEQIIAAVPEAQIMHNAQFEEEPAMYYALAAEYDWFGSDLGHYPAEAIAAIHDACDFVQPNVYSGNRVQEATDLRAAIAIGADGAMVNHPDVAAEVLDRPVATSWTFAEGQACLVGHHALGLPSKSVTVGEAALTTGRGGCVPWSGEAVSFAGDGSALASSA